MKISNPTAVIGEDIACKFLEEKGYRIIERNFRKLYTEVDIICVKDDILVFVEVKTRKSDKFGKPIEQISNKKLMNLIKTSEYYSQVRSGLPKSLRIDVIGIALQENNKLKNLEHIENITL